MMRIQPSGLLDFVRSVPLPESSFCLCLPPSRKVKDRLPVIGFLSAEYCPYLCAYAIRLVNIQPVSGTCKESDLQSAVFSTVRLFILGGWLLTTGGVACYEPSLLISVQRVRRTLCRS